MDRECVLQFGAFALRPGVDLLYRGEAVVPLEPRASGVLRYLVENSDRVVTKDEILARVWSDVFTTDGVLKKAVSQIRRALGDDADQPRYIATYHARGYRFVAPVTREQPRTPKQSAERARAGTPLLPNYDRLAARDAEMLILRSELRSAFARRPRVVVLTGEEGIGKTQLVRHFCRTAVEEGAVALYSRFSDYAAADVPPFQRFVDLLRQAFGVEPADSLRDAIAASCGVTLPSELFASGASPLTAGGTSDPSRFVVPVARALVALSRREPTVLVFDDLQWADATTLDILSCVIRSLTEEPLMLVACVREQPGPDFPSAARHWLEEHAARGAYTTLRLGRLDENRCREMIGAIFGIRRNAEIPRDDVQQLVRLTNGNPYFLVETLRHLVGAGAIAPEPAKGRWTWRGLRDLPLPATIVTAARARVERLDPPVREAIETAAVAGDEFRVATIAEIIGREESEVELLLGEGVRSGILSIQGVSPGEDCRFRHEIVRHVVYDGIPPQRRRALHRSAALALERACGAEPERFLESLATHFAAAGDPRRAFDSGIDACRLAMRRSEWRKAASLLERLPDTSGAAGLEITDEERLELLLVTCETWHATGRGREALSLIVRALALAERMRDEERIGLALLLRGSIEAGVSDYAASRASLVQAIDIFLQRGCPLGLARAVVQLAAVETAVGNYDRAVALLRDLRDRGTPDEVESRLDGTLGWALALRGDFDDGAALLENALARQEPHGGVLERALLLRRLHWVHLSRGEYEAAIRLAIRARTDSILIGDADGEARANMGIGQARLAQGLHDEAASYLRRALGQLQLTGDAHCEAECLWQLGRAALEMGTTTDAATLLDRALAMVRRIGDRDDEFRILTDQARLQIVRGDLDAARKAAQSARTIAASLRNPAGAALADVELARIEIAHGNAAPAAHTVRSAATLLERCQSSERLHAWLVGEQAERLAGDAKQATALQDRARDFLDSVRNQVDPDDTARRRAITRNAERLAERWL